MQSLFKINHALESNPMPKILIPVDSSDNAKRAVQHAVKMAQGNPSMQLFLLNVQERIEPRIYAHMTHEQVTALQAEEVRQVLQPLERIFAEAGVAYRNEWRIGSAAPVIADYAKETGCDEIVMGTRGMSAIGNLVMGSTATKVVHLASVPVTLVK